MQKIKTTLLAILAFSTLLFSFAAVACKEEEKFTFVTYTTRAEKDGWGWITLSSDNMKLSLDTKPLDNKYPELGLKDFNEEVLEVIQLVHYDLKLPGYVYEQIINTSKSDGVKSYENDNVYVWWSYNSTDGLEVTYQLR